MKRNNLLFNWKKHLGGIYSGKGSFEGSREDIKEHKVTMKKKTSLPTRGVLVLVLFTCWSACDTNLNLLVFPQKNAFFSLIRRSFKSVHQKIINNALVLQYTVNMIECCN